MIACLSTPPPPPGETPKPATEEDRMFDFGRGVKGRRTVLQWSYHGNTVVLQWSNYGVTVVLLCVPAMLQSLGMCQPRGQRHTPEECRLRLGQIAPEDVEVS
jgi:hypothetical protein